MAKFDFYRQQSTPQSNGGPGPVARAVPNDVGANVLDAGIRIGGQAVQYVAQRQEDAAAIDASSRVMAAHRHWIEREQQLRNEALESGDIDGLTERVTKEYEQYAAAEIGQAKTPAARQWMQERMGQLGLSMFERTTTFAAGAKIEQNVGLADRALSDAQVIVDADPTQFGAAIETLKLPFARLPPEKRDQAWRKALSDVAERAARRGAEASPRTVLQALDAEPGRASLDYVNALDADGRDRARVTAEGRIRELEAEARARRAEARDILQSRMENQYSQIEAGVGVPDPITRGEFAAAGYSAAEFAGYQAMVQQGADYRALWRLPESDIRALVAGRDPAKDPGSVVEAGFAARFRLNQRLRARADDVLAKREKDPGAYIVQYSPRAAQAYQGMITAQQAGDSHEANAAAREYYRIARSEAQRLGIRNRNLLPAVYTDAIAAEFAEPGENAPNMADRMAAERARWGDMWPQVSRQINAAVPPTASIIGSGVSRATAIRLSGSASLKPDEVDAQLPTGVSPESVKTEVRDAMGDFFATYAGQPNSAQMRATMTDAGYRLAASYIAEGASLNDAATRAARELASDRYNIMSATRFGTRASKVRLPTSGPYGPVPEGPVLQGLLYVMAREIRPMNIPRLADTQWLTLPDDSGVGLFYNGELQARDNGTPISYSWQRLREMNETLNERVRDVNREIQGRGWAPPAALQ